MNALPPPPLPQPDWAWFLDLDGTLLEPHAVVIPVNLVPTLVALRSAAQGALAVISGRPVQHVLDLLEPLRLAAAGLHGLERVTPDGRRHRPAQPLPPVGTLRRQLQDIVEQFPQTELENKGPVLAVHFRHTPEIADRLRRAVRTVAARNRGIEVLEGKQVFELRPAGQHKGLPVDEFMAIAPFLGRKPVFIGDDRTDEDGFRAVLALGGLAIRVGPCSWPSLAQYGFDTPTALRLWLAEAAELLKRRPSP
jgi:trehalose 6-phosphate phosphatase